MSITESNLRRIIRKSLLDYVNESKVRKYIRSLLKEDIAVGDDFDEDAYNKEQSAQLEKIYKELLKHREVIIFDKISKKDPQSMYKKGKSIHKFLRLLNKFEGSDEELDPIIDVTNDKNYKGNLRKMRKLKASDMKGRGNLKYGNSAGQLFKFMEKVLKMINTNDYIEEIIQDADDFMKASKAFEDGDKKKPEDPFGQEEN